MDLEAKVELGTDGANPKTKVLLLDGRFHQNRAKMNDREGGLLRFSLASPEVGCDRLTGMDSVLKPGWNLREAGNPGRDFWSPRCRVVVFVLASTSILSLLVEFYGWCSMRTFTFCAWLPALFVLLAWALLDRAIGSQRLWRAVVVGSLAGLAAACAYDLFRVPFVFARTLGIQHLIPPLQLFKVFPRFGAMLLGQATEQSVYSTSAQLVGWSYHFSNGLTFGVMYVALLGNADRRQWAWGVLFAVGLEAGMLLTPYPRYFGIGLNPKFVTVTLAAHTVFGIVMGLAARALSRLLAPSAYR